VPKVIIKGSRSDRIRVEMPDTMEFDPAGPNESFIESIPTLEIKTITIEGDVMGIPSGSTFKVGKGNCTVTFEIGEIE